MQEKSLKLGKNDRFIRPQNCRKVEAQARVFGIFKFRNGCNVGGRHSRNLPR